MISPARTAITERDRTARFVVGVFSKQRRYCEVCVTTVNGEPGDVPRLAAVAQEQETMAPDTRRDEFSWLLRRIVMSMSV